MTLPSSHRARPRFPLSRLIVAAALLLGAAATGGTAAGAPPGAAPVFWVDPTSYAARQAAQWRAAGRLDDALLIDRIATRPSALLTSRSSISQILRVRTRPMSSRWY
ncbi:hypothetical protein ABZ383_28795, partial [Streptomyces sp. NPDC005900]